MALVDKVEKHQLFFLLITVFSINTPFCCFESSRKLFWFFGGPFLLSIMKKAMQSGQNGHHLLELFRRVLKQVFDNEVSTSYILFLNSWDIWGLPKPFLKKKIGLVFQIGHVILNYKHFYHVTYILTTVFFYNYRFNTEIHTICKNIHSWDSLLFFHDIFF